MSERRTPSSRPGSADAGADPQRERGSLSQAQAAPLSVGPAGGPPGPVRPGLCLPLSLFVSGGLGGRGGEELGTRPGSSYPDRDGAHNLGCGDDALTTEPLD